MADPPDSGQPLVSTRSLRKTFGSVVALDGVDLAIEPGEFVAIFGPNGAGKTTLVKILSTVMKPTEGCVTIMGMDAQEEDEKARGFVGVISHETFLYPHLTSRENLRFYGTLYGVPDLTMRIAEVLRQVDLAGLYDRPVRTFSHGMARRLTIARALLHRPRILLLDEPYAGLDQQAVTLLRNILQTLHTPEHAILMATHNLERGFELCDRVAIQARGRIVYESRAEDLDPSNLGRLYFQHTAGER